MTSQLIPNNMATTTRASRKRRNGGDATNASKKAKRIRWEWLGDGGKWNQYSDKLGNELTSALLAGKDEVLVGVAPGVKMRARFDTMSQANVSTGWQRDLRCLEAGDTSYQPGVWEWSEGGVWSRYPDSSTRHLEACHLCGCGDTVISMSLKPYKVSLHDNKMTNETSGEEWDIRRKSGKKVDQLWEWLDEGGTWQPYTSTHCELLEDAHTNQQLDTVDLSVSGRGYTVDLSSMIQTNKATGVTRQVRRFNEGAEPSVGGKSATKRTKPVKQVSETSKVAKVSSSASVRSSQSSTHSTAGPSHSNEGSDTIKSQVFTGKCPVDTACTGKLGKAHVLFEAGTNTVWNCTLNQTNINNNNNKFYIIQLLEDNNTKSYSVWFRWGRVGKSGQSSLSSFGSNLDSAKSTFAKKFSDKTNNAWEDRNDFVKIAGKYDLLEVDYDAKNEDETDAPDEPMEGEGPQSSLDPRLQSLIQLICNVQAMEDIVKEMKYDTKKAPLGKLTSSQIKHGYLALKKIEGLISEGAVSGRDQKLVKACDEFYTRIPHDFGMRTPPLIKTKELVKQKLALLETLGDIQIAMKVIQGGDRKEHPLDRHYKGLHCQLDPLDNGDEMVTLIEKYIKQTHGKTHTDYTLSVTDVFEMDRDGEEAGFRDHGNRQLLWHGSRLTNWVGILSQGLRIAPPEAPVTGYMFGKGIYFADVASKSANYCFTTPSKNEGICLLCEVSLGTPNELLSANSNGHKLPVGTHSVKGLGRMAPNSAHDHTLPNGCVIPLGHTHDTGVRNAKGYTLNYNEFVVYDTCQIKMKYLVRMKFNYK